MRYSKSWTDSQLVEAVRSSTRLIEVASKLYSTYAASHYSTIKYHIARLRLDCSHFENLAPNRVKLKEDLFVVWDFVGNLNRIRLRLREIRYSCEACGNTGDWNGKPLILQMDHKNGNRNDNRLDNLRWLCPNCHSQTETFGSKNRKSKMVPNPSPFRSTISLTCSGCGKPFQARKDRFTCKTKKGQKKFYCSQGCANATVNPSRGPRSLPVDLPLILKTYQEVGTYVGTAKALGVSDSYIARLIRKHTGTSSNGRIPGSEPVH